MGEISQERQAYHGFMDVFIKQLSPGSLVYDIGKSHLHDYRGKFEDFKYKTIDRDKKKDPDVWLDIEEIKRGDCVPEHLGKCDAMLCNGVVEQCDDPMQMIRSCNALLRMNGTMLFGSVLLGYPPHQYDRFRFTKTGALAALERYGFEIQFHHSLDRAGVPSYVYAICKKVKEI